MEVNGYKIEPGANLAGANVRHASLTSFNDGMGLPPARANLERTNLTGTRMPDGLIHD